MTREVIAFPLPGRDSQIMNRRNFISLSATATAAACVARNRSLTTETPATHIDAATFHAMRRTADTPYGRIAYVERGSGESALFLHAYPLNGFQWRGALERLSPYRRCIAPDLMGLGYTEVGESQSLAPADQVAMLVSLLDRLSVRSVDLVANDSGGAIAQLLVARYPTRVRTVLLTNCDVVLYTPPPALAPLVKLAKAGVFADRIIMPLLADKNVGRGPDGIGGVGYQDPTHPTDEAIDYYFTPLVSSPLRKAQVGNYAIALDQNPLIGIEPKLKAFAGPVRIVWGTADTIFAPESAAWLDHAFSHSRGVRRVEGAKVFFPEEQPDLIAAEAGSLWK
jgi:haloalkane dehalogenase